MGDIMNDKEKDDVVYLYLDDIIPNRFQPREVFDERALKELAISIREHGVIQPIIVRSVNGKYEIIAGERRYKASALAGLTKIPAIVRNLDDKESSKVALLENLQRKNLNPIEEARTYQKILEIDQMTQEELAKTMGKSQSSIANKIRLLTLPEEIQQALLKEEISERHARSLLAINNPDIQKELLNKIVSTKMSVRALEDEIKEKYSTEAPTEMEEAVEEKPQEIVSPIPEMVPSTSAFVNSQPLAPTAELPKDESNYGKVTIVPPIGEEQDMNNKFINYGEINKVEEQAQVQEREQTLNAAPVETTVDVAKLKENTTDIVKKQEKGTADLDNLLNLGNPTSSTPANQFITPAEKIVKTDALDDFRPKNSDYFQITDLTNPSSLTDDLNPMNSSIYMANSNLAEPLQFINPALETGNKDTYTLEDASNKIKELVKDLEQHGIKISSNEMDFEKSYQVIIKIDKE